MNLPRPTTHFNNDRTQLVKLCYSHANSVTYSYRDRDDFPDAI